MHISNSGASGIPLQLNLLMDLKSYNEPFQTRRTWDYVTLLEKRLIVSSPNGIRQLFRRLPI